MILGECSGRRFPRVSLSFVIDALDEVYSGSDIEKICRVVIETRPESLSTINEGPNQINLQDLPQIAADYEFRLSTIFSTQLCITDYLLSYAVRGSKDERGPKRSYR